MVFWVSVGLLAYAWFGYPAFLAALAKLWRRPVKRMAIRPSVSLIVPVHNAGSLLVLKLENLNELDYPPGRLEVIVVDDCSTDDGRRMPTTQGRAPLRFVCLGHRSGKAAALNAGLEIAQGEIVGFTDVASILNRDALALAVERFADPRVGCVSSEDVIAPSVGIAGGEGLYTRIDTLTRRLESVLCSATGMNGSFYLARRELCPPFPLDVATDMFSALHCFDRGYRAVVEERSIVRLTAQPDAALEFERKVRTMVTGLCALREFRRLLNPRVSGVFSLFLVSHKLLRYLTPALAVIALASVAWLSVGDTAYRRALWAVIVGICIGNADRLIQRYTTQGRKSGGVLRRLTGVMAFACMSIAAASVAWYRYLKGTRYRTWQPTQRRAA